MPEIYSSTFLASSRSWRRFSGRISSKGGRAPDQAGPGSRDERDLSSGMCSSVNPCSSRLC